MNKKRILIVEDDVWLGELFESVLSKQYDTRRETAAEAAIAAIDDFQPHALLLDVLLDGANGIALLHELRSYDDTSKIPVVLCTSLEHVQKNARLLQSYGVKKVLDKAVVTPAQLRKTLEGVLL